MRKDYNTAWRDYMPAAQKGNSDAQAAIGALLFLHRNHQPGHQQCAHSPRPAPAGGSALRPGAPVVERSAEKGDRYAMGYLAVMLDSGIGGPANPARAAQLREQLKQSRDVGATDKQFVKTATADPETRAMAAAWQSGHYADALAAANARAVKGDAAADALLGRAYYEGVGVPKLLHCSLVPQPGRRAK
jgi:TPR repeat protein